MINKLKLGKLENFEGKFELKYLKDNISYYFPRLRHFPHTFIFESKDVAPVYGRLSLIGFDPVLHVYGKDNQFFIRSLNQRGKVFLNAINKSDFKKITKFQKHSNKISGIIQKEKGFISEEKRTSRKTIADALRLVLEKFKASRKTFCGCYGAFAYDFVRLFEDLPEKNKKNNTPDFSFFLFDSFLHFDHLKEKAQIILIRQSKAAIQNDLVKIQGLLNSKERVRVQKKTGFKISSAKFDLGQKQFEQLVETAKDLARRGELFEIVFSRSFLARFSGDPFALYRAYEEKNPSPYMFFFDFGKNEYLVGASPEMMIRVEDGLAHTRPISGTMPRGKNPIEDHENMLELLSSEKERSELDMLIDLGRNDLARICRPGIGIKEYRTVENYSRVMHTVAHVTGRLKENLAALDAYIACANNGTLTGAPKVAAMTEIEKHEKTRRGYYGGNIGYFSFSGEMDTGIIIRSAHIKKNKLELRVGATLLFDSDPTKEFYETEAKAKAFLDTIKS